MLQCAWLKLMVKMHW